MKEVSTRVIVRILQKIKSATISGNIQSLKKVAKSALDTASIFQEKNTISVAVIAYAIFKLTERKRIRKTEIPISLYTDIIKSLDNASINIYEGKIDEYGQNIKDLFKLIGRLDDQLPLYIEEIVNKAKIKKGFLLHEKGISLERAAHIMGISQWDLMNYVGKTQISEHISKKVDIRNRLNFTRTIFNLK
tara:strand:- start:60 stop:629 length:570 start_codon:yes stop_codon:yes gene_type:complete